MTDPRTPRPSVAARRAAKREHLLDAAMAVIEEHGVDGFTVAALAKKAGSAVGAMYRYFDGKQAVIVGLQLRAVNRYDRFQRARLDALELRLHEIDGGAAALARVWMAFAGWAAWAQDDPINYRLLDAAMSDPDEILDDVKVAEVTAAADATLRACADLLDAAVRIGALREGDAALRTQTLWAGVHGAAHFRKRDRFMPAPLHAHLIEASLIGGCLTGWGASRDTVVVARELAT